MNQFETIESSGLLKNSYEEEDMSSPLALAIKRRRESMAKNRGIIDEPLEGGTMDGNADQSGR